MTSRRPAGESERESTMDNNRPGAATVDPEQTAAPAPGRARSRLRRVAPALVSLVIVVAVFWFFLPQFTSLSSVWDSVRGMSAVEVSVLVLAAAWNLATYGFVMISTMPGLTYRQAMVVTESSTAVSNTVPAGGAVGIGLSIAMYDSWGFSRSRSAVSLLLSGIWNNFAKLGMPVLALALLALQGQPGGGRVVAGLLGIAALMGAIVVFALLLRSEQTAARIGVTAGGWASGLLRLLRRPPATGWDLATTKFRARTILLLRARWHWLTVTTLVSHASLFLVLLLALRSVGVSGGELSWIEALAVFAFARLVTAIPLTPGGLGIVELALITGLSAAGGPRAQVAAAVLIFRALTYVLPIPFGLLTYIFWRRNKSWRRAPGKAPRTALVPESVPARPLPRQRDDVREADAVKVRAARPPAVRLRRDAVLLVGGAVVLLVSAQFVHRNSVAGWERGIFRLVNDTVTVPFVLIWPIMQLGNIVTVPVTAVVAALTRRFRLAAAILVGGGATYYLAKVVKHYVIRARPPELLSDVNIHGTAAQGLGYVSGHAGVVALIATVAACYLGRRARWAVFGVAGLVCLLRLYVGAHLPLDVVGGAALGVGVGGAMRLVFGRPAPVSPAAYGPATEPAPRARWRRREPAGAGRR
jgi:uncharacterized membrane protein YbhN (UPF0104 family)/membrane-associated phospholipid phosphatase